MKKKMFSMLLSMGLIAMVSFSACTFSDVNTESKGESTEENTSEDTAEDNSQAMTVGMIINQGSYYFQSLEDALRPLIEEDGGELIVTNANNDITKESSAIQTYIERDVDAILLSTQSTDASIAACQLAADAGIPVIYYNNGIDPEAAEEYTKGYIESDNYALGTEVGNFAAEYIEENFGGEVNIGIIHADCFEVTKLRHEGFLAALEEAGITVNIVGEQESWMADEAAPLATDIITANPDIDAFWASNDGGTSGAIAAVKSSGKEIVVFGTDINEELANYIANENILVCTIGQDGTGTGTAAYEALKTVVSGEDLESFTVSVPGVLYSINDIEAVNEYLESI